MTNVPAGQTPAGWYPDPAGTQAQRWWDGAAWTDTVQEGSAPQGTTPYSVVGYANPKAPEGTSPYNTWIWLNLIVQFVAVIPSLFFPWEQYLRTSMEDSLSASVSSNPMSSSMSSYAMMTSPEYLALTAVGWVFTAATILLGWLDYRALKKALVPNPFHWAWGFFTLAGAGFWVYVIGRSVVARRRTGHGLAPIWIYVAIQVVTLVVFSVIIGTAMFTIFSEFQFGG